MFVCVTAGTSYESLSGKQKKIGSRVIPSVQHKVNPACGRGHSTVTSTPFCSVVFLLFARIFSCPFSLSVLRSLSLIHPSVLSCIINEGWTQTHCETLERVPAGGLRYHRPPPGVSVHQQIFPSCQMICSSFMFYREPAHVC